MKTLLVFAAVAALVVATTISTQTTPAQATTSPVNCLDEQTTCNAHAHSNVDRTGDRHTNAGNVENEGGKDGSHFNHQRTSNDKNGVTKCTEHTNSKDR